MKSPAYFAVSEKKKKEKKEKNTITNNNKKADGAVDERGLC